MCFAMKNRILFRTARLAAFGIASVAFVVAGPAVAAPPNLSLISSFTGRGAAGNGAIARGDLLHVGGGKYFGTTYLGGRHGIGNIYEFDSLSGGIINKADFDFTNGASPAYGALAPLPNGNYLGATPAGGSYSAGVIYEFNPQAGSITKRADLNCAPSTTCGAHTNPVPAGGSKFLGVAQYGGAAYKGAIYEYDFSTSALSFKASFGGAVGIGPIGALVQDSATGLFFGTTQGGGANGYGTVYAYNSVTGVITHRADFNAAIGQPSLSMISAGTGKYIGTTITGGIDNGGSIYLFDSTKDSLTLLQSFGRDQGLRLPSSLLSIGDDNFLGTSYENQGLITSCCGGVFRYNLAWNQVVDIVKFPGMRVWGVFLFLAWCRVCLVRITVSRPVVVLMELEPFIPTHLRLPCQRQSQVPCRCSPRLRPLAPAAGCGCA